MFFLLLQIAFSYWALFLPRRLSETQRRHATTTAAASGNTSRSALTGGITSSAPTCAPICWRNQEWCFRWVQCLRKAFSLNCVPNSSLSVHQQLCWIRYFPHHWSLCSFCRLRMRETTTSSTSCVPLPRCLSSKSWPWVSSPADH